MSWRPDRYWYGRPGLVTWLLLPLTALFCALAGLRRFGYRHGWLHAERLPVPVVVVGNITVGGSGKTPLVAALVQRLREAGYRPGIVSRGYGGQAQQWPQAVDATSDPRQVGDEPVLLARATGCPVAVGPDRPAAAQRLLAAGVDVIVADDGLQHYRLGRDIEIAVVDGERRFGNGWCLPSGPLRERPARLRRVDFVVANGAAAAGEVAMTLHPGRLRNVAQPEREAELTALAAAPHAVAGIGHPGRFFAMLRRAGLTPVEHPFPDHHRFAPADLAFGDGRPVVMTEKDAVKCAPFAQPDWWYLPVEAELPESFGAALLDRLEQVR